MKHAIDELVTYGRRLTAPCFNLGENKVQIEMDYKIVLMSNYLSRRVIEMSGQSLEIGFIYGGSVTRASDTTRLRIDSLYVPPAQKIDNVTFFAEPSATSQANYFFSSQNKRIVGIGHSHADFDVFHSPVDIDNYKSLVGLVGVKVNHTRPVTVEQKGRSLSERLGRFFSFSKPVQTKFSYVLPSLVYNAKGEFVDAKVATRTYFEKPDRSYDSKFSVSDCNLKLYNKGAVLTEDDKSALDRMVRSVLVSSGFRIRDLANNSDSRLALGSSFYGGLSTNVNKECNSSLPSGIH